jgi:hypothetical protein
MRIATSRAAFLLLSLMAGAARAQMNFEQAGASPTPPIRDIRPPLDVFPYPLWIATALIVRAVRNRPKPPPPTAKDIALKRLAEAEADIARKAPYVFSIQVSDILRQYISAQYHLHAPEQTSPEFLAEAAKSPHFTGADKALLAEFLERCDLIKFAHVDATVEDSRALLEQAVRFVKGAAV